MRGIIMIKSKSELLDAIKTKLGGDTSDETIGLIEDISDTMDDYETKVSDTTNWKEKYEQNDAEWRQKYTDRFFSSGDGDDKPEEIKDDKPEVKTFDDLFTTEGVK
jgi:hypothetical protein